MNKGIIWAVAGVLVIVVGAYIALGMGKPASVSEGTATTTPATSLRELAASDSPQKCTLTSANNTRGVVYIAGGKIRGSFNTPASGATMSINMIMRENMSYVWVDGSGQGYKNSFDAGVQTHADASHGINPDERVSYDCRAWEADGTAFVLPQEVQFKTVSSY